MQILVVTEAQGKELTNLRGDLFDSGTGYLTVLIIAVGLLLYEDTGTVTTPLCPARSILICANSRNALTSASINRLFCVVA